MILKMNFHVLFAPAICIFHRNTSISTQNVKQNILCSFNATKTSCYSHCLLDVWVCVCVIGYIVYYFEGMVSFRFIACFAMCLIEKCVQHVGDIIIVVFFSFADWIDWNNNKYVRMKCERMNEIWRGVSNDENSMRVGWIHQMPVW